MEFHEVNNIDEILRKSNLIDFNINRADINSQEECLGMVSDMIKKSYE